jgi:hypothetical protein
MSRGASQGAKGARATNPLRRGAETAQNFVLWLDHFVFAGVDWIRMRGTQTDCGAAARTNPAFEHSSGNRRIGEALDGCARNAFEPDDGDDQA